MNEKVIEQLEEILIDLGENRDYINGLRESYKEMYLDNDKSYIKPYISHLKEIEQKYYGEVK